MGLRLIVGNALQRLGSRVAGHSALDSHGQHEEHHHHQILSMGPSAEVNTVAVCSWLIILVVFTVAFELALHYLDHQLDDDDFDDGTVDSSHGNGHSSTGHGPGGHGHGGSGETLRFRDQRRHRSQMLHKMKEELMGMGLLSLGVTFCSEAIDVSHDAKLPFEWAHTLLFVAALVRCGAVALGLVHVAEAVFSEAHAMDNMNLHMLQAQTSRGATTGANHAVDAAFLERAESFQAARTVFLRDQTLPAGFNFPMYLHRALYGFVLDLVEASPGNWAVVAGLALVNALRSWAATAAADPHAGHAEGRGMSHLFAFSTPQVELAAFATCGWLLLAMQWTLLYQTRSAYRALVANVQKRSSNTSGHKNDISNHWSTGSITIGGTSGGSAAEVKEEVELSSDKHRSSSSLKGSAVNSNSMMALFGMDGTNDTNVGDSPPRNQRSEEHKHVTDKTDDETNDTTGRAFAHPTSGSRSTSTTKDSLNVPTMQRVNLNLTDESTAQPDEEVKATEDDGHAHGAHSFLREIVSPSVEEAELNRQFRFAKEKRISFRADLKSGGHQASSPPSSSSSPESGSSSVPPCKPSPEGSASPKDGGSCSSSMSNSDCSTNSLDSSTSSDDGGDGDGPVTAADYGLEEGVWGAAESSTNGTSTGPDALVFHISTLLLLGSLYVAAFLLRYAEISLGFEDEDNAMWLRILCGKMFNFFAAMNTSLHFAGQYVMDAASNATPGFHFSFPHRHQECSSDIHEGHFGFMNTSSNPLPPASPIDAFFIVVSSSIQRALSGVLAVDEWLPPLLRVDLALGLFALLPLAFAWRSLHELVDRASFAIAVTAARDHLRGGPSSEIDAVLELSMVSGLVSADVRRRFFQRFGKCLAQPIPLPSNESSSPTTPSGGGHNGTMSRRRNSRGSSGSSNSNSIALEAADRQDANLRAIFDKYVPSGSDEMDPSGLKQLLEDCYDINNAHDDDHHKHKHKRPSGSSLLVGRWERVWESMNRDLRRGVSYSDFKRFILHGRHIAMHSYPRY